MLHGLFLDVRLLPIARGEVSLISPSFWLADKVREVGAQSSDFGRECEEVVFLTRNSREDAAW